MTDIHAIKDFFFFLSYFKEETWYMLATGIVVYVIYVIYLAVFERYHQTKSIAAPLSHPYKTLQERINGLGNTDDDFFERLSFIIRTYLEETDKVPFATKKTSKDIQKEFLSHELKQVLDICTYYEYTNVRADDVKRKEVLERLKNIS